MKDVSKPDGEACNPDGTLKDAEDIGWVNSPSDSLPPPLEIHNKHALGDEPDNDRIAKRSWVCQCSFPISIVTYVYLHPTSFQQCKKNATTHPIDDEIHSDADDSLKGPAGPSSGSIAVSTGVIEGDPTEEASDGDGIRGIETDSEDEDPVATG